METYSDLVSCFETAEAEEVFIAVVRSERDQQQQRTGRGVKPGSAERLSDCISVTRALGAITSWYVSTVSWPSAFPRFLQFDAEMPPQLRWITRHLWLLSLRPW